MLRTAERRVLWAGDRPLYDTATDTALRERLGSRGWVIEAAEATGAAYHGSLEPFALVHCWDLSAVDKWLPVLRRAREAGLGIALSPAYDEDYIARSRQRMLDATRPGPFPEAAIAWRFVRTQQRFALSQIQMLLPTAAPEMDAIHRAFPEANCTPFAIVPACIAHDRTETGTPPEAPGNRPYVLCVAPISPVIGQADIIRSALHAGITPFLVGTAAPEDAEYERECRGLTDETIWFPTLPSQQLIAAIRRARLVVHSARDVAVPLLGARLGIPVILPETHYAREYMAERTLSYRRSDSESLDAAFDETLRTAAPLGRKVGPAHSLDAATAALAAAYEAITAGEAQKGASHGDDPYARFLETELLREYHTNQMPDTVIATLEAQVAWYRQLAEGEIVRGELRRAEHAAEAMHALAHERFVHIHRLEAIRAVEREAADRHARQQEDRVAALAEEVAWRRQTMEGLIAESARYRGLLEMRVRAWMSRARGRPRLRPDK